MKVLVTGGAGFIGANLVRRLEAVPGCRTSVVDDLSTGDIANLDGTGARVVVGSVLDDAALDEAMVGADAVVHLAALPSVPRSIADPVGSHEANATGTLRVLEAVRRHAVRHVVVASSSSVYGDQETSPKHEDLPVRPLSPYAVSKLTAETYALAYARCYDVNVLVFRFFNVYGPLQPADHAYAAVVPAFVDAALAGRPLLVHGDGEQSRDFTYVGSLCNVITDALRRGVVAPGPVNLAFGGRTTVNDLVRALERVLGHRVGVDHAPVRAGDVRHSLADTRRLAALFPDAEPVALETGLRRTVDWFLQRAGVPAQRPAPLSAAAAPAIPPRPSPAARPA